MDRSAAKSKSRFRESRPSQSPAELKLILYSLLLFTLPLFFLETFRRGYADGLLRLFWSPVTSGFRLNTGAAAAMATILAILIAYVVSAFNEDVPAPGNEIESSYPSPRRDRASDPKNYRLPGKPLGFLGRP